ncbi:MAG: OpgC domain-containing protein [Pseudomonadota bacterium]
MRISELDFIRGFALITITVNHISDFCMDLGYTGYPIPTLTHLGYSSSAELFFLISGYLIGFLYFRIDRDVRPISAAAKMMGRSVYIWAMNCVLFVWICAAAQFFPQTALSALTLDQVAGDPFFWAYNVVKLGFNLPLLGILNFYVVLILLAIPFAMVLLRSPGLALLIILGLYAVCQTHPEINLPGGRFHGDELWTFNPLAWQALFFGGLFAGRFKFHEVLRAVAMERHLRPVLFAVWGTFVAVTLVYVYDQATGPLDMPLIGQQALEPVRLFHALLTFVVLLSTLFFLGARKQNALYRIVCLTGSNSLQAFMISVFLSYILAMAWTVFATTAAYIILDATGVIVLLALALVIDTYKRAARGDWDTTSPQLDSPKRPETSALSASATSSA